MTLFPVEFAVRACVMFGFLRTPPEDGACMSRHPEGKWLGLNRILEGHS